MQSNFSIFQIYSQNSIQKLLEFLLSIFIRNLQIEFRCNSLKNPHCKNQLAIQSTLINKRYTGAQFSLRTLCSMSMVHSRICVQLNRTQSVVHNRRGVRLVGAQLYPRVLSTWCTVILVHNRSVPSRLCAIDTVHPIPTPIGTIPFF